MKWVLFKKNIAGIEGGDMPRAPSEKVIEAEKLYDSGMAMVEIAKKLGVSDGTVRSWKSRYGWGDKSKKNNCNVAKNKCNVAKEKRKRKKSIAHEVEKVTCNSELTDKQQLFCIYYVRCFNATKAYQKAYGCDYISAMNNGSRMLRNDRIKEEILQLKQEKLNREFFSESDIFQKYIDIAFADITDYLEFGTEEIPVITKDGPVIVEDAESGGEKQLTKTVNRVKFKDSAQLDGTILSEVKQGKDGASIKLADRMKALQWLTEHMDMATTEQKIRIGELKKEGNMKTEDEEIDVQIYLPDNGRDDE